MLAIQVIPSSFYTPSAAGWHNRQNQNQYLNSSPANIKKVTEDIDHTDLKYICNCTDYFLLCLFCPGKKFNQNEMEKAIE